jgi:membrane protease YdiL (CAAX protease family)
MLFYVKKYIWLNLATTLLLGGVGLAGISWLHLPVTLSVDPYTVAFGLCAAAVVTGWTFAVRGGYALLRGSAYARALTKSLADEYAGSSILQVLLGGITAAFGEEIFFRGFIQGAWGIVASTALFGIAHIGSKEIRVISYWSFAHGLLFGLAYKFSGNLAVTMIAHGLFDVGGILYFRILTRGEPAAR